MKRLFGVTTAMVTPLDINDNIAKQSIRDHVNFLIGKGVNCLYPLGTTGEMHLLTVEERKQVAEIVVEEANKRVTVFIHTGAMNQKDTIELAKHANKIGADGIGVVTPSFFSVNDREMEEYYLSVARSVPEDFPLYLYNIPQCSGNDLKPGTAERIAKQAANVIGIKYSFADMLRTFEYLKVNNGNFSVVSGCDKLFHEILTMGCDGTISGISSVYPEPFVAVYKAFNEKNLEEARKHQKIANALADILRNGSNMAYFKAGLKMRGIDMGHMRKPLLDLTEDQTEELKNQLKSYMSIFGA